MSGLSFEGLISRRIKRLKGQLEQLRQEAGLSSVCAPPDRIFHYTTIHGLWGILRDQVIFATHSEFLNDSSEIHLGRDLVTSALISPISGSDEHAKVVLKAIEILNDENNQDFYIASFCEEGDLLSQWRGYADQGGGYAISFVPHKTITDSLTRPYELYIVIYDKDILHQLATMIAQLIAESIGEMMNEYDKNLIDVETAKYRVIGAYRDLLVESVGPLFHCLKHNGFKEEREFRLVHTHPKGDENKRSKGSRLPKLMFRPSHGIMVPYIALPLRLTRDGVLGDFSVEKVIHGPSMHPDLTRLSLEMMMRTLPCGVLPVEESSIPFQSNLMLRPRKPPV